MLDQQGLRPTFADDSIYDAQLVEEMQRLVDECTTISEVYVKTESGGYWTYTAQIDSDCFSPFYSCSSELTLAIACYSACLFRKIAELAEESGKPMHYVMSESHIQSELSAHLLLWFSPLGKGIGIGKIYNQTKETFLNVDEARKGVLFLMKQFGYTGKEVVIGGE